MRDHWDNEDWAEVEDMDETATSKGLKQSVVVLAETLTDEEEVSGDAAGFKDTVTQLTKTLESFKSSFDDTLKELQRLNHKIDEERKQNTGFKDAVTQLTETLKSFKSGLDDNQELQHSNMKMDEERKQKTLERALILTCVDSFDYYQVDTIYNGRERYSSDLAKSVIGSFMLGQSAKLPSAILIEDGILNYEWYDKTIKEKDTLVKKFVDKFVYQISILIGKQPRIVKVGESNEYVLYDIHYE